MKTPNIDGFPKLFCCSFPIPWFFPMDILKPAGGRHPSFPPGKFPDFSAVSGHLPLGGGLTKTLQQSLRSKNHEKEVGVFSIGDVSK